MDCEKQMPMENQMIQQIKGSDFRMVNSEILLMLMSRLQFRNFFLTPDAAYFHDAGSPGPLIVGDSRPHKVTQHLLSRQEAASGDINSAIAITGFPEQLPRFPERPLPNQCSVRGTPNKDSNRHSALYGRRTVLFVYFFGCLAILCKRERA